MVRIKKIVVLILVFSIMFAFAACGKKEEPEITLEEQLKYVEEAADKAGSMWELVCRLFPDYVIYKDFKGKFTYEKLNPKYELNTYDWSSLAGTYKGIDVSAYQGSIDWSRVPQSGVEFAFIRVGYRGYTEGTLTTDKRYKENLQGAIDNGIKVGAYFVTKALTEAEAIEEAEYFIERVKPYNITCPLVIDIEPNSNVSDRTVSLDADQRTKNVIAFCNTIKEAGYTPMIYGGVGTFMGYLNFGELEGISKWFAQYFRQPWLGYKFDIWQATDTGTIDGIKGNVDIDYAIVNYAK